MQKSKICCMRIIIIMKVLLSIMVIVEVLPNLAIQLKIESQVTEVTLELSCAYNV